MPLIGDHAIMQLSDMRGMNYNDEKENTAHQR